MEMQSTLHARLIEVCVAHGEEIGNTRPFRVARQLQAELLRESCPASILFIGAGHGDEAEFLLREARLPLQGLRLTAVDLSSERLVRFSGRFPSASVYAGDICSDHLGTLLKQSGGFDVLQMSFVLHDQTETNKPLLLQRCFELLRPGGQLLIADPTLPIYPNYLPKIPTPTDLEHVETNLHQYYQIYLDEVQGWTSISRERKAELIESLRKGLADALTHTDGREAFDTPAITRDRLMSAGFGSITEHPGFNSIVVYRAIKSLEST
jgi:ubiquinone/menaquinone biosynthesis C-methylase UbiE